MDGGTELPSFLVTRDKQTYSTKSNNLKALRSFCYNRLVQHKAVGMELATDSTGVGVIMKWRSSQPKPATSYMQTTINKNTRTTLSSIQQRICKNKYPPDLRLAAIRRASPILRSQRPEEVERRWPPHPECLSSTSTRSSKGVSWLSSKKRLESMP